MKPSRRLGRGLEDLVPLAPAAADGTARLDDALRGGPAASVLALSGRSVEDFVREEPAAARPAPVPWTAPPTAPSTTSPTTPPAARAEPVAPPPAAPRAAAVEPASPEPPPGVQFVLFDPPVVEESAAEEEVPVEPVLRETADAPAPPPRPAAPPAPSPATPTREVVAQDVVLLDDEIGGFVLPDVELE